MTAREAFWIALEALHAHKLRSTLTLLGVVIATTTLIVVISVVNGMNLYIAEHIANLQKFANEQWKMMGVQLPEALIQAADAKNLTNMAAATEAAAVAETV